GGQQACAWNAVVDRGHEGGRGVAARPERIAHRLGEESGDARIRSEGEDAGPRAAETDARGARLQGGGSRFGVSVEERSSNGLREPILETTAGEGGIAPRKRERQDRRMAYIRDRVRQRHDGRQNLPHVRRPQGEVGNRDGQGDPRTHRFPSEQERFARSEDNEAAEEGTGEVVVMPSGDRGLPLDRRSEDACNPKVAGLGESFQESEGRRRTGTGRTAQAPSGRDPLGDADFERLRDSRGLTKRLNRDSRRVSGERRRDARGSDAMHLKRIPFRGSDRDLVRGSTDRQGEYVESGTEIRDRRRCAGSDPSGGHVFGSPSRDGR